MHWNRIGCAIPVWPYLTFSQPQPERRRQAGHDDRHAVRGEPDLIIVASRQSAATVAAPSAPRHSSAPPSGSTRTAHTLSHPCTPHHCTPPPGRDPPEASKGSTAALGRLLKRLSFPVAWTTLSNSASPVAISLPLAAPLLPSTPPRARTAGATRRVPSSGADGTPKRGVTAPTHRWAAHLWLPR